MNGLKVSFFNGSQINQRLIQMMESSYFKVIEIEKCDDIIEGVPFSGGVPMGPGCVTKVRYDQG